MCALGSGSRDYQQIQKLKRGYNSENTDHGCGYSPVHDLMPRYADAKCGTSSKVILHASAGLGKER